MTNAELFDIWAPADADWSQWAKPVLFACAERAGDPPASPDMALPDMSWVARADGSTLIILDLPAAQGVWAGIALASAGYRPVPLYNAVAAPMFMGREVIDVKPIIAALKECAPALAGLRLPPNAPPAFMLDANRRWGAEIPEEERFDNRSVSLPTDFPSANLLLSRGVRQATVIQVPVSGEEAGIITRSQPGAHPRADLSHTLLRWQRQGIEIRIKSLGEAGEPLPITIQRPRWFGVLWYNFLATVGWARSPLGGFGGRMPLGSAG